MLLPILKLTPAALPTSFGASPVPRGAADFIGAALAVGLDLVAVAALCLLVLPDAAHP